MKYNPLLERQYSGSRTCADQADPWWLSPASAIAPQTLEKQGESVDVEPDPGVDDDWDYPDTFFPGASDPAKFKLTPMFPDESDAANEFYWVNISDADREYLTGPRKFPAPCPWCGGRYRHNSSCNELRASWELTLPFGKHKGKPLSAVPHEYLEWLASCSAGISDELCESIKLQLQGS